MTARESPDATTGERPVYRLLLKPEPRVDGIRALRALLKLALQRLGLRCISIEEVRSESARHDPQPRRHRSSHHRPLRRGQGRACPFCGPQRRAIGNQRKKVLCRRLEQGFATYHCARIGESGHACDHTATARFGTARRCPQGRRSSRAQGRTPAPWQGALALAPPQAEAETEAEARRHERRDPLRPGRCGDDPAARHAGRVGHLTLMEAACGSRTSRVRLINKVPEIHYEHEAPIRRRRRDRRR